jgi:multiple sugar transport system substrate-binding protein
MTRWPMTLARSPAAPHHARRFRRRLALLALTALLAACKGGEEGGKPRLRIASYTSSEAEIGLMKTLVAEFNAANPDVEAVYEPVPGAYYAKLLTMLVSRTAPDVFYLDVVEFRPFLAKDVLLPLDGFVAKSAATRRERFIPALWDAFTRDGHVFGVAKDFNAMALFYNKHYFDAAGLAYPDASWDLGRFREAAKALTREVDGKPVSGFALTHDNVDRYLPVAKMFGASLYGPDGSCAIAAPAAVDAMNWYAGLKLKDHAAIYPSEVGSSWTGDAFGRGNVAMAWEGGWLVPYLRETFPKLPYGVAPLPKGPAGRSNFLFTVAYAIPRTTAHPEAAWRLVEHLTSPEAQARVTFAIPSRKAEAAAYVRRDPVYAPIVAGAEGAMPFAFGAKSGRVKDRLGVAVQEIFLGAKPVERALGDAASHIDRMNRL